MISLGSLKSVFFVHFVELIIDDFTDDLATGSSVLAKLVFNEKRSSTSLNRSMNATCLAEEVEGTTDDIPNNDAESQADELPHHLESAIRRSIFLVSDSEEIKDLVENLNGDTEHVDPSLPFAQC